MYIVTYMYWCWLVGQKRNNPNNASIPFMTESIVSSKLDKIMKNSMECTRFEKNLFPNVLEKPIVMFM